VNGPQHYREAERLADQANHFTYGDGADPVTGAALAAEAQVHATLARIALAVELADVEGSLSLVYLDRWAAVGAAEPQPRVESVP
jgi:hypothetical protein